MNLLKVPGSGPVRGPVHPFLLRPVPPARQGPGHLRLPVRPLAVGRGGGHDGPARSGDGADVWRGG